MNIKIAASNMIDFIYIANLPEKHDEYGKDHLLGMCAMIQSGKVSGEKAHRWLGWVQGCLCISGCVSLKKMKENNKYA